MGGAYISRGDIPHHADTGEENRDATGSPAVSDGVNDLGRFAEPSLHILVSLSDGPKHGYAIMADVEAITGSPMGPGTLYGALARLERRGFIEALEPVDRRRPYRLTGLGEATVRAQLERLQGFARTGLARLREASS
jgi:DNA-binding PadR family transcriptional regulator